MGQSAGRAASHRTGQQARRRNTARERDGVDPPWDEQVVPHYLVHPEAPRPEPRWLVWTSYASMVGFMILLVLILGEWWHFWDLG